MQFTKNETNIAKGVAICLMLVFHLYVIKSRILNGNYYIPTVPFVDLEPSIARFGGICVSMFLFLSGYGMFLGYSRSKQTPISYSLKKIKDFYLTYWLYFLIFIPIGLVFFRNVTFWDSAESRYSTHARTFLLNFVGWSSTYNGEWWFIRIYILTLLIVFPLFIQLIKNNNIFLLICISLFLLSISNELHINQGDTFGFILLQISFSLGLVCAKLDFFSSPLIKYFDGLKWLSILVGICLCFLIRRVFRNELDYLIVPFFTYFSVRAITLIGLSKVFAYLGIYSFPIWLIHSFFCYYYFQNIVFFPRYSPLVFINLMTLSLLSVLVIEHLRSMFVLKIKGLLKKVNFFKTSL